MSHRHGRALLALGLIALVGIWIWREYAGWRVSAAAHALERVPPGRIAICRCAADSTLILRRDDGLSLAASLYRRRGDTAGPVVLLLHGLTPYGRTLPLYRILARELADAGSLVMTMDFAGFGESEDPYAAGSEAALDLTRDVRAALATLVKIAGDGSPVTVIGHSMGAIEAMEVGLADPRVGAVVAIGPPRRTAEVIASEEGRAYHWDRIRRTYDSVYHRELPAWFTRERFLALKRERDIERFTNRWTMPGHVPLLLVDGSREAAEDRAYLQRYAARVGPPSAYITIEGADHYLNSGTIGDLLYYDRRAVGAVVDTVIGFSRGTASRLRQPQ